MDFTDLVFLIGTNPLPNYVIARHFLKTNKKIKNIWMLHTNRVKAITKRLESSLSAEFPGIDYHTVFLEDEGNPQLLRMDIGSKLLNKLSPKIDAQTDNKITKIKV